MPICEGRYRNNNSTCVSINGGKAPCVDHSHIEKAPEPT